MTKKVALRSRADVDTVADRDALVLSHDTLALKIAWPFVKRAPKHCDREDLFQAARLGLCEAATRWKPDTGVEFGAFARRRIHGAIVDAIRKDQPLSGMRRQPWTSAPVQQLSVLEAAGADTDPAFHVPRERSEHAMTRLELARLARARLSPRLRFVVVAWSHDVTLARIGAHLGVTYARAHQLKDLGVARLREAIAA